MLNKVFFSLKAAAEFEKANARIAELEAVLEQIMLQETPYSNATVRRMSRMARVALGKEKADV